MSELRNRMIRDMQLPGLVEGTRREYLRAVRQLAATADGQHCESARGVFLVPVAVLSRKIAAQFCAALNAAAPAVFADIPASVWQREWVSFCKHYGHGNDAVLT